MKHIVIDARIRRSSTGRYVDRLVEHLQKIDDKHRYTVLVQPDDDWQPAAKNFTRQNCRYAQFSFNPLDQFGFARQLYKLKADLVHFPMNQQPVLYFDDVVTSTLDLTMLKFTRAGKTPLPIFWLKMAGYRFLFWLSNKRSRAVITISNYVREELAKLYPFTEGKTTTTYCASEPPLKVEGVKPKGVSEPFIMYVGTAFPHKNLQSLVDAMELLEENNPDLKLVLAGKREYHYEQLEKYAAKSMARDKVIFTGFVSDQELKWLYEHTACYVFPSLSEGFGLPGLEAMAHGAPVASSNATCLPEIYETAAAYFNPLDIRHIAVVIEDVVGNSVYANKLRTRGSKRVACFSWQTMAKQTLEVYERVLAGS